MNYAKVAADYGIVVREAALEEHGVTLAQLNDLFEADSPYDLADGVVSYGPHFGGEAAEEFTRSLEARGLSLPEDFFVFDALVPDWVQLGAASANEA